MTNSTSSSPIVDQVCVNGAQHVEILPAINDDHGGVIVEMKEAMDSQTFLVLLRASIGQWREQSLNRALEGTGSLFPSLQSKFLFESEFFSLTNIYIIFPCLHYLWTLRPFLVLLRASIERWREQGKKGVWIKLPIDLVNLVETAVKEGFWYHHAEPHYLMLVFWIPATVNTIPANATHRVGVGAIVLKNENEMLVVQEKSGRFRGTGVWKIPTGVVDEGEDIFMAAKREVKEETGIDTEFLEILAFRQSHRSFFGKSDLFFLCVLHPLSFDIQKQDLEIEAAQWMPFEEFANQPFTQKHGPFRYIADICLAKVKSAYDGFSPSPVTSFFDDQTSFIYLNSKDLKKFLSSSNQS